MYDEQPLHDQQKGLGGKRPKSACVGSPKKILWTQDLNNRAKVPATFELTPMLALGTDKGWGIGSLGVRTMFLHDELDDGDELYIVTPPAIIDKLGLAN